MPMYDLKCSACAHEQIDVLEPIDTNEHDRVCPHCGLYSRVIRAWLTKPSGVIGDECDVEVRHGLCAPDGTPRRFTSKAEMAREAKARGLVNHVEHIGSQGSDRSKHTSRWI